MPSVLNKRIHGQPAGSVYVGRPSPWGNPFTHKTGTLAEFQVGSRDEAVERYREWLLNQPQLVAKAQRELVGKDLVCWCAPARCHAHVLMEVANRPQIQASLTELEQSQAPQEPTGRFRRNMRRG